MLTVRHNFVSRTQMPINRIDESALKVRAMGISECRRLLSQAGNYENPNMMREVIATLNYTVRQCEKEIQRRKVGKK